LSAEDSLVTRGPAVGQSAVARAVTVAGGRFAPGHLGGLTRQVPFEMAGAALGETCRVQRRARGLPARVVACLPLAGCLFAEPGYTQVRGRLAAGLGGLPVTVPAASAMARARRRLGPGPLRELLCLLRGPSPRAARWKGLLVAAVGGAVMTVADSPEDLAVCSRRRGGANGGGGYPALRLLAVAGCGARSVVDAVFRPVCDGEAACARLPLRSPDAGVILLAGRDLAAGFLAAQAAAARADFLIRARTGRGGPGFPVLRRLPGGSWLSRFGGVPVRVIDAGITAVTAAGRTVGRYRLVAALADPGRCPAGEVIALCRERREIETACFGLKSAMLGGRVLRARAPGGVDREACALLVACQAIRTAIADAAAAVPGAGPDRASFTIALSTARDRVTLAAGVTAGPVTDLAGGIGRAVVAGLMPARRPRASPRVVKRALSKYRALGQVDRAAYKAATDTATTAAPLTDDNKT
jgi:hypothetical protein